MQTGKANYRLAARLRGNELLLDADLRKAVEEEHLRAVRRAAYETRINDIFGDYEVSNKELS